MRIALLSHVVLLSLPTILPIVRATAQTVEIHGQVSAWGGLNDVPVLVGHTGLRYIPSGFMQSSLDDGRAISLELSANVFGALDFPAGQTARSDGGVKLYRAWARYTAPQFEARLGLQRISFGSATLIRPLMWFDSIDPRDPLQLTDGVYALLLRYYFLNNANIWLWGVYGRDQRKGWEVVPSKDNSAEYGGRLQLPLFTGEAGLTFHRRVLEISSPPFGTLSQAVSLVPENRVGLDGKWDAEIGIWFEGAITHQESQLFPFPWQRSVTVGADYTFGIGTGLNVIAEYFTQGSGREAFGPGEFVDIAALSANYALNLFDNLSGILYFDRQKKNAYSFLDWRRTYDDWSFHLIGFLNPSASLPGFPVKQYSSMIGKGFQVIVVFNH